MAKTQKLDLKAIFHYMSYWKKHKLLTAISLGFSLCLALQQLVFPFIMAKVLGEFIRTHEVNTGLIVLGGILQFSFVFVAYITDLKGIAILHKHVESQLYNNAFRHLVYEDYDFFANRFSGSLVTQASRFAKSYTAFNDIFFFMIVPQLTAVFVAISVITYYSPLIGLGVLVLWATCISLVIRFGIGRMPLRRAAVAKESTQVGELADVITNAQTVKTLGAEAREIDRYHATNEIRSQLFLRSWSRAIRNVWVVEMVCVLLILTVSAGGIYSVQHGTITIATLLLFQVYLLQIIENIRRSNMIMRQIEVVSGDALEMTELLETTPRVQDSLQARPSRISKGAISFEVMGFSYADANNTKQLFEDFNLSIKPGEKIGLVGPSGGGKTTITRLLLRFMDIQSGAIFIDDQNIRDIKQGELRQAIAYVPQEPLLFHRSIKENIAYGKPHASQAEIEAVAKKAYAHDFIKELSQGYETLVGERGVKLSGGQRQRVAIARAMLTQSPLLVLDEATSALDSESEILIQKALWRLMKDKTAVVIAHRLSTIQKMDRIIVVDNGTIIEQGSHKQLLARDGLYARLWQHQSGGFIDED